MSSISEEQRLLLTQIDRACKKLRPIEDQCYLEERFNDQIVPIFGEANLLGLPVSSAYGAGQGADALTYALMLERVGEEGTSVRTFFSAHVSLGQLTIQRWGDEEQKTRYLPRATRGEIIMAFALTEPSSGSDPASLKTSFRKEGSQYIVNGTKAWISNGGISDAIITFAYPEGKRDGMCAFIVEADAEGLTSKPQEHKMGMRSSDTGTLYFDECTVAKENLLGPPGKGLSVAFSAIMNGRLSVAAGCLGVMTDCLIEASGYSRQRVQHGKKIGKHQLIQRHIATISSNLEAARLLTRGAAQMKVKSDADPNNLRLRTETDAMIARAKYFATNAAYDAADRAVQIFGANGYSFETRVARHLADGRACRIYEGTDEILQLKIAAHLLGREFESFR